MIAAYSPEARGRSERAFGTHQERLPKELAKAGITDMAAANRYLNQRYRRAHNTEFAVRAAEPTSAFVEFIGANLGDILCERFERTMTMSRSAGASLTGTRHGPIAQEPGVILGLRQI